MDTSDENGLEKTKEEAAGFAKAIVRAKKGHTKQGKVAWKQAARRRCKPYQSILQLNNQLRLLTQKNLSFFAGSALKYDEAFDWPSLDTSTDRGPDMVATYHYFSYGNKININCNWDTSHDGQAA